MYREGIGVAGIIDFCDIADIFTVIKVLGEARRRDPRIEIDHSTNLLRYAREVEDELAIARAFTPSWTGRIAELQEFVAENGRMPRQAGGDAAETGIGRWLHAQRGKVSKGTLSPRQRAALDAVGEWDSKRRPLREERRFPDQITALAAFVRENGRFPAHRHGHSEDELTLATWLYTVRQADCAGNLSGSHRKILDGTVPGWDRRP